MDKFETIVERASDYASAVPCTPREYRDGLKVMIERLVLDWETSLECEGDNTDETHPKAEF